MRKACAILIILPATGSSKHIRKAGIQATECLFLVRVSKRKLNKTNQSWGVTLHKKRIWKDGRKLTRENSWGEDLWDLPFGRTGWSEMKNQWWWHWERKGYRLNRNQELADRGWRTENTGRWPWQAVRNPWKASTGDNADLKKKIEGLTRLKNATAKATAYLNWNQLKIDFAVEKALYWCKGKEHQSRQSLLELLRKPNLDKRRKCQGTGWTDREVKKRWWHQVPVWSHLLEAETAEFQRLSAGSIRGTETGEGEKVDFKNELWRTYRLQWKQNPDAQI